MLGVWFFNVTSTSKYAESSYTRCPQERLNVPPRVEYRYVPRSFTEEQSVSTPISSVFGKMFSDRGPWEKINGFIDTYPWQRQLINSKVVLPFNNPSSGFGRAVGDHVI